jgi:hypothetical protein
LYTTTFMFINLDFIYTRICYGFLNENNHQDYSVLFVTVLFDVDYVNIEIWFLVWHVLAGDDDNK